MFITYETEKSATPRALLPHNATQWRTAQVLLYAPWFVLSVGTEDLENELFVCNTWLVGATSDLRDLLIGDEAGHVLGLVCVRPTRMARPGLWEFVQVAKVWLTERQGNAALIFADQAGNEFLVGPSFEEPLDVSDRVLLIELPRVGV